MTTSANSCVLGMPAVLGELVAGMTLGNLAWFDRLKLADVDPYVDILSRIGMRLLLFEVGVGLSVRDLYTESISSAAVP